MCAMLLTTSFAENVKTQCTRHLQVVGSKRPAMSPAFEEAVRSGKIAMRRRLRDRLSDTARRNLAAEIVAQ